MIPNAAGMALAMALFGARLLHKRRQRTDEDRLRDLDISEARHQAKLASPAFIAAAEKRERKRLKLLSLAS